MPAVEGTDPIDRAVPGGRDGPTDRRRGPESAGRPAGVLRAGRRRPRYAALALVAVAAVVAASCGSGGSASEPEGGGPGGNTVVAGLRPPDEGTPRRGGTITYGLEGKTDNFCLGSAQLAISGIMIAQSVYETLTMPSTGGKYVPYLARSVEASADNRVWTIGLRDGVRFHDGTPLDAAAVALNIEKWRQGPLLGVVFSNVASVSTPDPKTVTVTMKEPWPTFPMYLYTFGRTGIAAPAQLNDPKTCQTNMIGTGPFRKKTFDPTTGSVDVVRNPDYWRKGLPYLDGIRFRIQEDGIQRVNGLRGGQFDVIHSSAGATLARVRQMGDGFRAVLEPPGHMEVGHLLFNVTRPPLDDVDARRAVAQALDRRILNRVANAGSPLWRFAEGPYDTDVLGYVKDAGQPEYDLDAAREAVRRYKAAHGGRFQIDLHTTYDQLGQKVAQEIKRQLGEAGITVRLARPTDQGTLIATAITGGVDAFGWRNYPGGDPDSIYVWFHSGSILDFNHLDDPRVDRDLDQGRVSTDPAERKELYQDLMRYMAGQVFNYWLWYQQWWIGSTADVHGVVGPGLPGPDGRTTDVRPPPIVAGNHQLVGMWTEEAQG